MNNPLNPGGLQGLVPKENIVLKAGTVVKVGGFPFRLVNDTAVEGHQVNLAIGLQSGAQLGNIANQV